MNAPNSKPHLFSPLSFPNGCAPADSELAHPRLKTLGYLSVRLLLFHPSPLSCINTAEFFARRKIEKKATKTSVPHTHSDCVCCGRVLTHASVVVVLTHVYAYSKASVSATCGQGGGRRRRAHHARNLKALYYVVREQSRIGKK